MIQKKIDEMAKTCRPINIFQNIASTLIMNKISETWKIVYKLS